MICRVSKPVLLFLAGLALALSLGMLSARIAVAQAPAAPVAGSVDARRVQVSRSEGELVRVSAQRKELEARLKAVGATIEKLKAAKADAQKLSPLLAQSQELARSLQPIAARVRVLETALSAHRRGLIEAIDRELSRGDLGADRRVALARLRADAAQRLAAGASKIVIAQPKAGPLDDPGDLLEKAAILKDSEAKLRKQVHILSRRADGMDKRLKLRKAQDRAEGGDLFADDSPRRRAASSTSRAAAKTSNNGGRVNGAGAPAETQEVSDDANAFAATPGASPPPAGTDSDPVPMNAGTRTTGGGGVQAPRGLPRDADAVDYASGDPTVILTDVLDPETLAELKTATRGGDPAKQIAALRRAETQLKKLADTLARQQAAMRKRAAELKQKK